MPRNSGQLGAEDKQLVPFGSISQPPAKHSSNIQNNSPGNIGVRHEFDSEPICKIMGVILHSLAAVELREFPNAITAIHECLAVLRTKQEAYKENKVVTGTVGYPVSLKDFERSPVKKLSNLFLEIRELLAKDQGLSDPKDELIKGLINGLVVIIGALWNSQLDREKNRAEEEKLEKERKKAEPREQPQESQDKVKRLTGRPHGSHESNKQGESSHSGGKKTKTTRRPRRDEDESKELTLTDRSRRPR